MRGQLTGTLRLGAIPTAMTVASMVSDTVLRATSAGVTVELESLSSLDIMRRLADYEIDAALTYLDDDALQGARKLPYEERHLPAHALDGPCAAQLRVSSAQAAELPLVLLSRRMRNRRILDGSSRPSSDGCTRCRDRHRRRSVRASRFRPLVQRDLSRLAPDVRHPRRHAGRPAGRPGAAPRPGVGLVVAAHERESAMVRALLEVAGGAGVRDALDALLETHLHS